MFQLFRSLLVGTTAASDVQACLDACRAAIGCNYFTFRSHERDCDLFENCVEISTECDGCVSGSVECSDLVCGSTGTDLTISYLIVGINSKYFSLKKVPVKRERPCLPLSQCLVCANVKPPPDASGTHLTTLTTFAPWQMPALHSQGTVKIAPLDRDSAQCQVIVNSDLWLWLVRFSIVFVDKRFLLVGSGFTSGARLGITQYLDIYSGLSQWTPLLDYPNNFIRPGTFTIDNRVVACETFSCFR